MMEWYESFPTIFFEWLEPGEKITIDYVHRLIDTVVGCNADTLMFCVQNGGRVVYNSRFVPKEPSVGDLDLLKELVEEAHRKDLKLVAWWLGQHDQWLQYNTFPEWVQKNAEGKKLGENYLGPDRMCFNSPFLDYLKGQVHEVLAGYDVDGIFFDTSWVYPGMCYCTHCKQRFRKLYDADMPTKADWKDPNWHRFIRFRYDTILRFCHQIRKVIDQVSPETIFILNCSSDPQGWRMANDIPNMARYIDVILPEFHLMGETIGHIGEVVRVTKAESGRPVWASSAYLWSIDCNKSSYHPEQVKIALMEAVLNGGNPWLGVLNIFNHDRKAYNGVKKVFGDIKKLRKHMVDSKPVRYAALLHSRITKNSYYAADPAEYVYSFRGFYNTIVENHIPFDVVASENIEKSDLSIYSVLVMPDTICLNDSVIEQVEEFVSRGGGLVATFLSSLADDKCCTRDDFALSKLFGCHFRGKKSRSSQPLTVDHKGEPFNYCRITGRHPITKNLSDQLFSYKGSYIEIECEDSVETLAHVLDFNKSKQKLHNVFGWFPGNPSSPLLTVNQKYGRVVYSSGQLDAAFWMHGCQEASDLLANSLIWAGGGDIPIQTRNCPRSVEISVCHNLSQQSFTVLLANHTTNQLYPIVSRIRDRSVTHPIRYFVPISNIDILLHIGGIEVNRVSSIGGKELEHQSTNGILSFRIPELQDYEAIIIE